MRAPGIGISKRALTRRRYLVPYVRASGSMDARPDPSPFMRRELLEPRHWSPAPDTCHAHVCMAMPDKPVHDRAESQRVATADRSTLDSAGEQPADGAAEFALTILHHPDGRRVGERARLGSFAGGVPVELSRMTPHFRRHARADARPLAHPRLSRAPVWLRRYKDTVAIEPSRTDLRVQVDDQAIEHSLQVELAAIRERGVLLALGGSVLLYLHQPGERDAPFQADSLQGISPAMCSLARAVARAASLPGPVFVRGEAGLGKKALACAIHRLSGRAHGPWIPVDLAAIPDAHTCAELFGARFSAGTHPERSRVGCFQRAHQGTLFLDHINWLSQDAQAQLLRLMDAGSGPDVRLITGAADDLQTLAADGRLRPPLAYQLQQQVLYMPPLRTRRADIPLLLHRFLRASLADFEAVAVLEQSPHRPKKRAWLRLELITRLLRYPFPGNVVEVRNIAAQIAAYHHDQEQAALPPMLEERLAQSAASAVQSEENGALGGGSRVPGGDDPGSSAGPPILRSSAVRAALRANRWNISRTARALSISRNTLMARIRALPDVRLARDLGREELERAKAIHGRDLDALADSLQVSGHGLRLRLRELGLD